MDFAESDAASRIRADLREWLARELPPGWRATYDALDIPAQTSYLRRWHAKLSAAGFVGASWPIEFGGRGLGVEEEEAIADELGRVDAPPPLSNAGTAMAGPAIIAHGTRWQRDYYLPRILSGEDVWCQGYSEPGAGSDLSALRTEAVATDSGDIVVRGQKIWTSRAAVADKCLLLTRCSGGVPGSRPPMCILLVDMRLSGITVRPIDNLVGIAEFNEVFFDDVRVPPTSLLGTMGEGWTIAMQVLERERLMPTRGSAPSLATVIERLVGLLVDEQPQADLLIASGEALALATAHRALRTWQLGRIGDGTFSPAEASYHKLSWDETIERIYDVAVDVLGDRGSTSLGSSDRRWLEESWLALTDAVAGGTTEMQRNAIARSVLKLRRPAGSRG